MHVHRYLVVNQFPGLRLAGMPHKGQLQVSSLVIDTTRWMQIKDLLNSSFRARVYWWCWSISSRGLPRPSGGRQRFRDTGLCLQQSYFVLNLPKHTYPHSWLIVGTRTDYRDGWWQTGSHEWWGPTRVCDFTFLGQSHNSYPLRLYETITPLTLDSFRRLEPVPDLILYVVLFNPLEDHNSRWAFYVYDMERNTHKILDMGFRPSTGRFELSKWTDPPEQSGRFWQKILLERLPCSLRDAVDEVITKVPARNNVPEWNSQYYVLEIIYELEQECLLDLETRDYRERKEELLELFGTDPRYKNRP